MRYFENIWHYTLDRLIMVPEQPVIMEHVCALQISSNLQFSTKVLKFGTLSLFQSLIHQTFLALRWKRKSFDLDSLNWPSCTDLQHFSFTWFIIASEVAFP